MNKKKLVDNLISDESTKWIEDDRDALMGLSEKVLERITPVANEEGANKADVDAAAQAGGKDAAAPAEEKADEGKETKAEEKTDEPPTENKVTVDDYINKAPEELQGVLRSGLSSYKANKARLIKIITANKKNRFTEEQLNFKELAELQSLAALASDAEEERKEISNLNFSGQQDPVENATEEKPLELPVMNFDKKEPVAATA